MLFFFYITFFFKLGSLNIINLCVDFELSLLGLDEFGSRVYEPKNI